MTRPDVAPVHCSECQLGTASRRSEGQMCPFITRQRRADELIYLEGEAASYVWFVKRGTVVLFRESGDESGEGRVRAVRFPGSFVGLEALVAGRYIDSARAVSDVTLCGAPRDALEVWLGPRGSPARAALEMSLRTACADYMRRAAPDGNAQKRVAAWLCDEGPQGPALTLPRRIAADLLGMRPETLSRALAALAKRGAIKVTRRDLSIIDGGRLAEIAGHEAFE